MEGFGNTPKCIFVFINWILFTINYIYVESIVNEIKSIIF